ncbi:unnamed protein product [Laminaria digitata]
MCVYVCLSKYLHLFACVGALFLFIFSLRGSLVALPVGWQARNLIYIYIFSFPRAAFVTHVWPCYAAPAWAALAVDSVVVAVAVAVVGGGDVVACVVIVVVLGNIRGTVLGTFPL